MRILFVSREGVSEDKENDQQHWEVAVAVTPPSPHWAGSIFTPTTLSRRSRVCLQRPVDVSAGLGMGFGHLSPKTTALKTKFVHSFIQSFIRWLVGLFVRAFVRFINEKAHLSTPWPWVQFRHSHCQMPLENPSIQTHLVLLCCIKRLCIFGPKGAIQMRYYYLLWLLSYLFFQWDLETYP